MGIINFLKNTIVDVWTNHRRIICAVIGIICIVCILNIITEKNRLTKQATKRELPVVNDSYFEDKQVQEAKELLSQNGIESDGLTIDDVNNALNIQMIEEPERPEPDDLMDGVVDDYPYEGVWAPIVMPLKVGNCHDPYSYQVRRVFNSYNSYPKYDGKIMDFFEMNDFCKHYELDRPYMDDSFDYIIVCGRINGYQKIGVGYDRMVNDNGNATIDIGMIYNDEEDAMDWAYFLIIPVKKDTVKTVKLNRYQKEGVIVDYTT